MTIDARDIMAPPRFARPAAPLLVVAFGMALIGARERVVEAVPDAAAAYARIGLPVNLAGLELRNLRTTQTREGDQRWLAVEGDIVNIRTTATSVPALRLAVRDAERRDLYVWNATASKGRLDAGERLGFRARLASPPEGARDVRAVFAVN